MSCLDPTLKAYYQARYDYYVALLVKAEAYYDYLMGSEGFESFKFDSGEAMTWAKYTEPADFLKVIGTIESKIDYYRNKINGTGIVRLNLARGR
jgi:hypothetical protein